jgi:hypothetical protein
MSLLNVRLTKADEEAIRILKRSGVEISQVVRAAIRREAEKHRPRTAEQTARLVAEIFERHPEPDEVEPRTFDVHDRRAFAAAFREHLRKRPRRQRR